MSQDFSSTPVSWFKSHSMPRHLAKRTSLGAVFREIQTGAISVRRGTEEVSRITLAEHCERARDLCVAGNHEAYTLLKRESPAFSPSGVYNGGGEISLNGLLCIEFDGIDVGYGLYDAIREPTTLAAWESLSGDGIAVLVHLDPVLTSLDDYEHAWLSVVEVYSHVGEVDRNTSKPSQLRVINYAPNLYVNWEALGLRWTHDYAGVSAMRLGSSVEVVLGELSSDYVDAISAMEFREDGWGRGYVPCPFTEHEKDGWGLRTNRCGVFRHSDDSGYTLNCLKCSTKGTYRESFQSRALAGKVSPLGLYRNSEENLKPRVLDVMDLVSNEDVGRQVKVFLYNQQKRVAVVNVATGTGKTHQSLAFTAETGTAALFLTPTTELAKDVEDRAGGLMKRIFRYEGLNDENCVQPTLVDNYRRRGGNPYKTICKSCWNYESCKSDGYLSQAKKSHGADLTIMPILDEVFNPQYEHHASVYLSGGRTVFIDEARVHDCFTDIVISRSRLEGLRDMWEGEVAGDFAVQLLTDAVVEGRPWNIFRWLDSLSDEDAARLTYQLTAVRLRNSAGNWVEYSSLDTAVRKGAFGSERITQEMVSEMPVVDRSVRWTILDALESHSRFYSEVNSPMRWGNDGGVDGVYFPIPPRLHEDAHKVVMLSASIDVDAVVNVFGVDVVESIVSPPTRWVEGSRGFQLADFRLPRRSVLSHDDDFKWTGFLPSARKRLESIVSAIERMPSEKHALISYRFVLDRLGDFFPPELLSDMPTANFGGLTGLDTKFKDVDVLWVLFAPEVPPFVIEQRARLLFGNVEDEIRFERDSQGYVHPIAQRVYDGEVRQELYQAVSRLRLSRTRGTVVAFTAVEIPGFSDHPQTETFTTVDWLVADGVLDRIGQAKSQRHRFELMREHLTAESPVEDFVTAFGCGLRAAYQKKSDMRAASRTGTQVECDDVDVIKRKARQMRQEGAKMRDIADALGKGLSTVSRWLKS